MTALVRNYRRSDLIRIHCLLSENGWEHRIGTIDELEILIARSQRTAVAELGGEIVGFARGITDGISNGYLSMVVVAPEFRRLGIGRALVSHLIGSEESITWMLRAGRAGAEEFFGKLGFQVATIAMERNRTAKT